MLVAAVLIAALVAQAGDRESVLAVAKPVAAGEVIERADLKSVQVAGVEGAIATGDAGKVMGSTAAVSLTEGQIVTEGTYTSEASPGLGRAVVGLSLTTAKVPTDGLEPGDAVVVVAIPADKADTTSLDEPKVLAEHAQVLSAADAPAEGGTVAVSVVVPEPAAAAVSAYSAVDRISLVKVSARGGGG
ncbi:MAG: SAF domain-containing protein [Stackebrandtia sp.]